MKSYQNAISFIKKKIDTLQKTFSLLPELKVTLQNQLEFLRMHPPAIYLLDGSILVIPSRYYVARFPFKNKIVFSIIASKISYFRFIDRHTSFWMTHPEFLTTRCSRTLNDLISKGLSRIDPKDLVLYVDFEFKTLFFEKVLKGDLVGIPASRISILKGEEE